MGPLVHSGILANLLEYCPAININNNNSVFTLLIQTRLLCELLSCLSNEQLLIQSS